MGVTTDRSGMPDDCIFCAIVAGDIPARTVYEDDDVKAFLDVNPLSRGHTVVIPKTHHATFEDLDADAAAAIGRALAELTPRVEAAVDADGTTVGFNNRPAAGQEVMHVHGHIVPRFDDDGGGTLHSIVHSFPDIDDDEFDAIAAAISDTA